MQVVAIRLPLALVLGALVSACNPPPRAHGEDDMAMAMPAAPSETSSAAAEPPEPALPPGSLARSRVDAWLLRGPSNFLQKVRVSAVQRQNRFVGWRLDQLSGDFAASGLQQGDVVTSANGMGLESQDDFFDVWKKMTDAEELRIAYERNGKPSEAILKIVGAPDPSTKQQLDDTSGPPSATAKKGKLLPKRGTIVITDETGAPIPEGE